MTRFHAKLLLGKKKKRKRIKNGGKSTMLTAFEKSNKIKSKNCPMT